MLKHVMLTKAEPGSVNLFRKVIVCGAPERAALLAAKLKNSKLLAKNREYHSYLGYYNEEPILITSHGVGSSGAAICFQELIDVGAEVIIRLGTAGGLYDDSKPGDIAIAVGAVRKDGVSSLMIPVGYPALPDLALTYQLVNQARSALPTARAGIVVSSDLFYPGILEDDLALYAKAGVIAVEMECATLFVVGRLRKIATGSVLILDGNPLKWEDGVYDPQGKAVAESIDKCGDFVIKTLADFLPQKSY
jgi:uridine phosphorylase